MEFLAWPVVGLILGVFALLMLRKALTRLIDRTERVSKDGIQTRTAQDQQSEKAISKVDEVLKIHDNPVLIETEKSINATLDSLHPRGPEEREKYLLRNFSALLIAQGFEKTYYRIYGSQLNVLRYLNDNRAARSTVHAVRPMYEDAVRKYQPSYTNYSFDNWLGFLVATNLVQRNADDIAITIRGVEFLKFLVGQGYTLNKWG